MEAFRSRLRPAWWGFALVAALFAAPAGARSASVPLVVVRAGPGIVRSSPGTLVCHRTCVAHLPLSHVVTLTAAGVDGSTFIGWSGACSGPAPHCSLFLDGAASTTARFAPRQVSLDVVVGGAGKVVSAAGALACGLGGSTCAATLAVGSSVRLTASSTLRSDFAGWRGACTGGEESCVLTLAANTSVRAVFRRRYPLMLGTSGSGAIDAGGSFPACLPPCSALVPSDAVIPFAARTTSALEPFSDWTGPGCVGVVPSCSVAADAPVQVTAAFGRLLLLPPGFGPPLELTVSGPGTVVGSGISCGPTCLARPGTSTAVLSARPAAHAAFVAWGGDCAGAATNPNCTVDLSSTRAVTATFRHDYPLTVTGAETVIAAGRSVACTPSCTLDVPSDQIADIIASTPLSAFPTTSANWGDACAGSGLTCSLAVDAPTTVRVAHFRSVPVVISSYGLSVSLTAPGTISTTGWACVRNHGPRACSKLFARTDRVRLVARPTARFTGWLGSCTGTRPTCLLAMNQTRAVIAEFRR